MTPAERNARARAKRAMDKALKGAFRVREPGQARHHTKSRALRAARQAVEQATREALARLDLAIAEAEAEETPAKDKP